MACGAASVGATGLATNRGAAQLATAATGAHAAGCSSSGRGRATRRTTFRAASDSCAGRACSRAASATLCGTGASAQAGPQLIDHPLHGDSWMKLGVFEGRGRSGRGALWSLLLTACICAGSAQAAHAGDEQAASGRSDRRANFNHAPASPEARRVADWVVASGDNAQLPFIVVDKTDARVFVFQPDGTLRQSAPALLGSATGDDSAPGIGDRPLSSIRPEERTTPAGRFIASLDRNLRGGPMLWIDYETAVSMHPVITSKAVERRAQRLASPTPLDNRISYGCINVPPSFFRDVVMPTFKATQGVVYVLPEVRRLDEVFVGLQRHAAPHR